MHSLVSLVTHDCDCGSVESKTQLNPRWGQLGQHGTQGQESRRLMAVSWELCGEEWTVVAVAAVKSVLSRSCVPVSFIAWVSAVCCCFLAVKKKNQVFFLCPARMLTALMPVPLLLFTLTLKLQTLLLLGVCVCGCGCVCVCLFQEKKRLSEASSSLPPVDWSRG